VNIVGKGFLLLLGCATLASAVLTLWLWPRLAGRGAKPIAGRIALLLGTQLSLAATFLFTINAAGGFYTSWAQLLGDSSTQYHLDNAGPPAADGPNAGQLRSQGQGHGQLVGLRSGLTARLTVYTPAASYAKRLPVEVVDLTGAPASASGGVDFQRLADTYHVLVAVVTSQPTAAVTSTTPTTSTTSIPGVNIPDGAQGELFWSQDLRSALIAHYRVDTSPDDWGVAGVGQSGGAAINLAVQDSADYGVAAAVGDWTSAPPQDDWPGIDRYLTSVPAPAVRLLYNPNAPGIPGKLRLTAGSPLQVATQSNLTLASALTWLGAAIQASGSAS
jgi:hypothetical protein